MHVDPEAERWDREYPKFPGVTTCVALLSSPKVHGTWVDIICQELTRHADECADELLGAFGAAADARVRAILMGILCEAKLSKAQPVFIENLKSDDELLRHWAEQGLRDLNTKESRTALWNAGIDPHKS